MRLIFEPCTTPHRHCLIKVGASTSHNTIGLHGLLQRQFYLPTSQYRYMESYTWHNVWDEWSVSVTFRLIYPEKGTLYLQNRGLCGSQIRSGYGGVMIQFLIVPSLESRSSSSQTDSGKTIFKTFLLSLQSYNQVREIWTGIFDFVRVAPLEVKALKTTQTVLNGRRNVVRRNLTTHYKTFFSHTLWC
jgi:hypothetical protein